MAKINLLSSKVYNRIAAGEVVDRPYSIVKELVENSIDAGAKNISIDIIDGGKTSITVSDDGCGMDKSDLSNCIKAHATSKIKTVSDLDAIETLGFRGEALASIASVSKLTITTKTEHSELGACLYTEGGEDVVINDCGSDKGTEIVVNNLFFNTPAREKFLRTDRSEEGEITSTVAKFILGNPNVSFKYSANGKLVYHSFGDGLASAMVQVFGTEILNDCFEIETIKNGLKIFGYVSKHYFTKGNRTHQYVFLNNRSITNQTISSAVSNAYSAYLMKGRFPFFVLNLTVPAEIVDVNVHPNKSDVRFSNNQIIYSSVYSVISKVLDGTGEALNIITENKNLQENPKQNYSDSKEKYLYSNSSNYKLKIDDLVFSDVEPSSSKTNSTVDDIFKENKAFLENLEISRKNSTATNTINNVDNNKPLEEQIRIKNGLNLSIVGQALNTFLILEDGKDLYLVDQHAAHERILYDKLLESFKSQSVAVQPLLLPYVFNASNNELEFILSKKELLYNMGFDIDEFGKNSIKISSVPSCISSINLEKFTLELLSDLNELKGLELAELLSDKIAQKACKSAIKSGDKLDKYQIDLLLEMLKGNLGLKCPHGRPVVIKISRTEIDKWFKRIV